TEGTAGGSGHISMRTDTIPAFPAGAQLWFVQAVDNAGNKSLTSNTTITGFNVDADEPNGRGNATEAKALTLPTTNRPETYSPAGDQDYFLINASPGETIQASAVSWERMDLRSRTADRIPRTRRRSSCTSCRGAAERATA